MHRKLVKRMIGAAMVPALIATAAFAQTPEAVDPPKPSESETPKQKAHREQMEELQRREDLAKQRQETGAAEAGAVVGPLSQYKGAAGEVDTTDTDHGVMEITLLSSLALREAADELGERLCLSITREEEGDCGPGRVRRGTLALPEAPAPIQASDGRPELCAALNSNTQHQAPGPPPIVIIPESQTGLVDLAEAFDVRSLGLGRQLCSAIEAGENVRMPDVATISGERAGGVGVAAIAEFVNTAANMLRSDYTLFGFSLTADQNLLVRELARAVMARAPNPVYAPTLFPAAVRRDANPVLRRLEVLDALRAVAVAKAVELAGRSVTLGRAITAAGANAPAALQQAKSEHDAVVERLRGAIKAYDDVVTELTTPQGTQPPAMAAILRQAHTAQLLRGGALLAVTHINFIGGTAYTRQNFFSGLFGMPYRASGGVLVSYSVHDGRNGQLWDSISVPVAGGFVRPTELRRAINGRDPDTRRRTGRARSTGR
jgi:hypothetical protein